MILFLSLTSLFLSVILISFNAKQYKSSIYLSLFFLFLSLYSLYHYILVYSHSEKSILVVLFMLPIIGASFYLIGPLLFWYVRSVLNDNHRFTKRDVWHLLPAVAYFLAALPDLFTPISVKSEAAMAIAQDTNAMSSYNPVILSNLFSFQALFLSRPLLVLAYTFAAFVFLSRFYTRHKKPSVFARQLFIRKWLIVLLGFVFVLALSQILILYRFTSNSFNLNIALRTIRFVSISALGGMLISPFFFPSILYGMPRFPMPFQPYDDKSGSTQKKEQTSSIEDQQVEVSNDTPLLPSATRGSIMNLEEQYLDQINEQVEQCLRELQPYQQQDFNMAQLAVLLKIPVHHLAYFFREKKKQTFSDFRNAYRVEHAKNLIREGKTADLTLEAIGMLSGFSSRNTFLNAFKKAEGMSPHAYLLEVKKK